MAKTKPIPETEQPIPENLTFTKEEFDVVMAGRAARLIAAGEMPSLAAFAEAVEAAKVELRAKLRLARGRQRE
jgi:hypothetical protein